MGVLYVSIVRLLNKKKGTDENNVLFTKKVNWKQIGVSTISDGTINNFRWLPIKHFVVIT